MHHKQMTSMQWIRMDYEKLRVIKDREWPSPLNAEKRMPHFSATFRGAFETAQALLASYNVS